MQLVSTFYRFIQLESSRYEALRLVLTESAERHSIRGLILLGVEGINGTFSGAPAGVEEFKRMLLAIPDFHGLNFSDSWANSAPFQIFKLDLREEIVTLARPELFPGAGGNHLDPHEWHQRLQDEDTVVLDVRNDYESAIGKFKGALECRTKKFSEFPDFVRSSGLRKEQTVLMYCTGGIRCEKAYLEMERQGFRKVYQLRGGILNYLRQYPRMSFEGECFVFDERVAVNQDLQPSNLYSFCAHCGNPAETDLSCRTCGKPAAVCAQCRQDDARRTCSKNCRYHSEMPQETA